jgi:hypothetical protein
MKSTLRVAVLLLICLIAAPGALAQAWPDVFNPFQILTLNLQLTEQDWDTIRHDLTNEIEVPAWFWAGGESPILVSVRRKSSRALPSEADPIKVGLKIDINELVDGQKWRDLTKVSLENGADSGVVKDLPGIFFDSPADPTGTNLLLPPGSSYASTIS